MFSAISNWWYGTPSTPAESADGSTETPAPPPAPLRAEEKDTMLPIAPEVTALNYSGVFARGEPDDIHKEPKDLTFEPCAKKFNVRGGNYLQDRVKVASGPQMLRYVASDLIRADNQPKLKQVGEFEGTLTSVHPEREFLVLNWQLPASPPFSYVCYFLFPNDEEWKAYLESLENDDERARAEKAMHLLRRFVDGGKKEDGTEDDIDEKWRKNCFKMIPQIVEGPWYIRTVTPSNVPALVGNKLTTTFFRGKNYFELDIDITSSFTANTIWSLVCGVTANLVIDLGFVCQGNTPEELPEQLIGTVRLSRISLDPERVRVVTATLAEGEESNEKAEQVQIETPKTEEEAMEAMKAAMEKEKALKEQQEKEAAEKKDGEAKAEEEKKEEEPKKEETAEPASQ